MRKILVALDGFLALTAIAGGIALLAGWMMPPTDWLTGSPFTDYTIPGLALLVLVGGGSLVATVLLVRHSSLGILASGVAGLAIIIFEIVEAIVLMSRVGMDGFSWLQPFYFLCGLLMAVLAARLWFAEHAPATSANRAVAGTVA